jgi:hypothetical protein
VVAMVLLAGLSCCAATALQQLHAELLPCTFVTLPGILACTGILHEPRCAEGRLHSLPRA